MSKKLDPEEKARRKKERDHAYYVRHYDEQKARYRTNGEIWRREHPERVREIDRKARATLRQTVIAAYGGKCACCGIDDWHFLSIDHINNDGAKHRMETRFGSNQLYHWLKLNGYPKDGFQVLCYNCNLAKAHCGGVCPHQINPNSLSRDITN